MSFLVWSNVQNFTCMEAGEYEYRVIEGTDRLVKKLLATKSITTLENKHTNAVIVATIVYAERARSEVSC